MPQPPANIAAGIAINNTSPVNQPILFVLINFLPSNQEITARAGDRRHSQRLQAETEESLSLERRDTIFLHGLEGMIRRRFVISRPCGVASAQHKTHS